MSLPGTPFLQIAREIAGAVLSAHAEAVDREARWPEQGIRALQRAGLGGLVVPRAAGGHGEGLLALAQVCEVLAQECASTAICFGMHCVGAAVISAKATPAQVRRYLEPIARGEHLTTLALSEPGTGSHFYIPQAELTSSAAGFRANGIKSFITNGGHADSYVVSVTTPQPGGPTPAGQFSCVVMPGDARGLLWEAPWAGFGMRGNSARTARLDDVALDAEALLGNAGDQIWYVFNVIAPYFMVGMAGTYLGVATAALAEVRSHLTHRRYGHTGRPAAEAQVVQHRVGTLYAMVERTRQLIYRAASAADLGEPEALALLCSAKAEVAECVVQVTNEAMSLCGGIAFREGARLQRHLRDARAAPVMAPTTEQLRLWVGRAVLDLPLLAD